MVLKKKDGEWILASKKNPKKVLRHFGKRKPSEERVKAEERRIHYFEHLSHQRKRSRLKPSERRVGQSWIGDDYKHGPRLHDPGRYSEFRLGPVQKGKTRQVFGKVKGTNKWERQSTLHKLKTVKKRRKDGVVQRYKVKA